MGTAQALSFSRVAVLRFKAEAIDAQARTVEGYASTPDRDSFDEIVLPTAFTRSLPTYMENPIVRFEHDPTGLPIGKTLSAEVRPEGFWVRLWFGRHSKAQEVWTAIEDRLVRCLSVGFNGDFTPDYGWQDKQTNTWTWTDLNLKEISVVTFPACPSARFDLAKSLGLPNDRPTPEAPTELPAEPEADDFDARIERAVTKLETSAETVSNALRRWEKRGEVPSSQTVAAALSATTQLVGIVKAGRVLSAANRAAVDAAMAALSEVCTRDDASRMPTDEPKTEGAAKRLAFTIGARA